MICNICLETLQNPFVTPCGHVFCQECLISSSRKSPDATKAPCPTCRATFSLVTPDPAFIPKKYHPFIDSNIRRVYLDDSPEAALQQKVAQLESRIKCLERDKSLLMDRCESHMAAATSHAERERDARMLCATLQQELKKGLQQANLLVTKLVEKEAQKKATSTSVTHTSSHPLRVHGNSPTAFQVRPTVPLPKRQRLSGLREAPGE